MTRNVWGVAMTRLAGKTAIITGAARGTGAGIAQRLMSYQDQTAAYTANRGIPGEVPLESIAASVAFLASDDASHITGVDLPVDGGASAGHFIEGLNSLE